MAAVVMVAWVRIPFENRDKLFDHVRSHLALPTVPIVALESVDSTWLELEPDGLHLQLLSYKGIVAARLTLYRAYSTDKLTFLALALHFWLYYIGEGTSEVRIIEWVASDHFVLVI
ncbi:hypothetical protein Tco_0144016 [Tanacetum coccineum]